MRIVGGRVVFAVVVVVIVRADYVAQRARCVGFGSCRCSVWKIVIDRHIGQRRLAERLSNKFALLVLEMREVASRFFLGDGCSFSKTLLVTTLDDLRDTLVQEVM